MKIAICICTRRRTEQLKVLLESLKRMSVPSIVNLTITIVENDIESTSKDAIERSVKDSQLNVKYHLEPERGLVFARNRAVREAGNCDFCCFIDDDQCVESDFLDQLVRCQSEFNADGVSSRCIPMFGKPVPAYIMKFHTRSIYDYGHIIQMAGTGGLMLKKTGLDQIAGPFDTRFNLSGCEDIYLTTQFSKAGGTIRYTPDATIFEVIPNERTTIPYVFRRAFADSNAEYFFRSLSDEKYFAVRSMILLCMKLTFGLLIALPYVIFTNADRLKGFLKIIHAVGGMSFFLGRRNQFYS